MPESVDWTPSGLAGLKGRLRIVFEKCTDPIHVIQQVYKALGVKLIYFSVALVMSSQFDSERMAACRSNEILSC
jgi:hypothetical protein